MRDSLSRYNSYPEVAAALVTEAWKDVLLLVGLRKGLGSDDWKSGIGLLDKLLWSVQPKATREERQELLQAIPDLLKGLRTSLRDISYDRHKMTRVFKELQTCHLHCLKGKAAQGQISQAEVKSMLTTSSHFNTTDIKTQTAEASAPSDKGELSAEAVPERCLETAMAVNVGSWLEMTGSNGDKFRAKLAWRSDVSGRCLFVNRKGMKVAELQLEGLAMWLEEGRAVPIAQAETPLMDRALNAMVNVLNGKDFQETQSA